ncbi:hypothetical protein AB0M42_18185 [Streptomyces sp. NPDC051784]|uniref:hypothetical protein n=1 Tax=Streptomyces sp. NPDC051784 TaxID=3155805 RepID=UPI003440C963
MRIPARRPTLAVAALVLAAATACSSGQEDSEAGSGLLTGLGTLAGEAGTKQVTYLDAAEVRKLSKDAPKRFAAVSQPAGPLLNASAPGSLGTTFKETQIDTAVDTEEAGHWEGSFDADGITAALKSNGYSSGEKDGKEVWTRPDGSGAAIRVSDDAVSYSVRDSDPMSLVDPEEGSSLADDKNFRRAAECLGDVYRADFAPRGSSGPVRLASLGQRATSAAENTEVLCFVVKDDTAAEALGSELREIVDTESPKFDGTKVTVEKGDQPLVRAVVPDTADQRPGRLIISDIELWTASAQDS